MFLTRDQSIISENGKVIFFSIENFKNTICFNDNCFICGANPSEKEFNNEHILPRWVLKKYNLFSSTITLPNLRSFSYDKYKISCCKECNSLLGKIVEHPIKNAFSQGYKQSINFIRDNPGLIYKWLALIYLKTHLKDKTFRIIPTKEITIGETYDWENLHHIHCIVRTIYTGIKINYKVFGSLVILPALKSNYIERFDFLDLYEARTIFIKLDDIAIICVLNDSCAVLNVLVDLIKKINGPLSPIQLRELTVKFAYSNLRLKNRPEYYSHIDGINNAITIETKLPEYFEFDEYDESIYGKIFYQFSRNLLDRIDAPDKEFQIANIKKGIYTYLFDENGDFNTKSMQFIDITVQ